jgi:hypothetical protein
MIRGSHSSARLALLSLVVVAALAAAATSASAQRRDDRNPDFTFKPPTPEEMQQAMSIWMELGQPSLYHERLEYFVGEWETTTKLWMGGADGPAQESTGSATYSWLMAGRWLQENLTGTMMGMPFEGYQLLGYDNYRREYVAVWVDSFSTTLTQSSGLLDESGKVITLFGEMDEPTTGELGKMAKYVTRIVDDDTFVFEVHDLGIGGDNTRVMEITYRRKA